MRKKISGKDRERPQLKECLSFLREGDILHVHSMDRLSRNLKDLLNIVSELVDKNVSVKFKTENLEFAGKDIELLKGIVAFDAALLKERQAVGRAKAVLRGVKLGREAVSEERVKEIKRRYLRGDNTKDIAKKMKLARSTIYKYI